jgi:hypothetical protein
MAITERLLLVWKSSTGMTFGGSWMESFLDALELVSIVSFSSFDWRALGQQIVPVSFHTSQF